ncbi:acyl-CoA thioester hydrolase [Mariprofundus micogutta]|uniref:Acyl-CoA thioester hydrolase n=1 Tax=Mariprofundus micogutta TaxID=1921010 RepID=A0A1L8CQD5_9PROT|nr:tol-pal system-associated acyl-CoA thioesterase [Mariprofundus micogutta]GAV21103.1 acyl-CoA thioester hydrolase [Mariprofundus micogutta]
MTSFTETWPVRVYYEDTDHGGVVYYANYLKFMERARSEFLRSAGLELDHIESEFGVMFAVTQANVRYLVPARFNEMLNIESELVQMRGARIAFRQRIYRQLDGVLLTEGDIHLACIRRDGNVSRIPKAVRESLKSHLNKKEEYSS